MIPIGSIYFEPWRITDFRQDSIGWLLMSLAEVTLRIGIVIHAVILHGKTRCYPAQLAFGARLTQ